MGEKLRYDLMPQGLHCLRLFELVTEVIKNLVSEAIILMTLCKNLVRKRRGFFLYITAKPAVMQCCPPGMYMHVCGNT